jgi:WD40 repeat protein
MEISLAPITSSKTSTKQQAPAVTHIQTMRGHTDEVRGVLHLPGGRRIITCSSDGSLRLWDLVNGTQIGGDWRDNGARESAAYKIALSPNGKIVSSGSQDGKVRLWDVKTGRVIRRWTGHTGYVSSVCWSANGKQIMSGSWDGRVRVWNVKRGERILEIKTGHEDVWAAIYSPDNKQIATGGFSKNTVKIWDAKLGELITTLKHDYIVCSLAWTSDGKQLISASYGLIRIFDTATWRLAAILGGHRSYVNAIALSRDNRLLASTSDDGTVRLWNLETNLPVGPPIQHEHAVECAALSADGKLLVTGCSNTTYTWDIHVILKHAGLEDLLPTKTNIVSADIKLTHTF